jgi:hypothetical protein
MMMFEEETGTHTYTQGMDKIKETSVKDTHFFINMELDHNLPVIQLVSILKQRSSKSLVEYWTTLHRKHLLVP